MMQKSTSKAGPRTMAENMPVHDRELGDRGHTSRRSTHSSAKPSLGVETLRKPSFSIDCIICHRCHRPILVPPRHVERVPHGVLLAAVVPPNAQLSPEVHHRWYRFATSTTRCCGGYTSTAARRFPNTSFLIRCMSHQLCRHSGSLTLNSTVSSGNRMTCTAYLRHFQRRTPCQPWATARPMRRARQTVAIPNPAVSSSGCS